MSTTPPLSPIRLMIVDDSELVRMGLRTLLDREKSLQIVAEASNVAEAISAASREKPLVVLMDIRLPDGSGFEACRKILDFSASTAVIFLTSVVDDKLVDEAIRSGGCGYLLKELDGMGVVRAIKDVAAGKSILDPAITERVMKMARFGTGGSSVLSLLSPQETKVLASVAEGKTNKEVGVELGLTEKTVKNYLASIFSKLKITSRTQAAILYRKNLPEHQRL